MTQLIYFLIIIAGIAFAFGSFRFKKDRKKIQIWLYVDRDNKMKGYGIDHIPTVLMCREKGYSGQVFSRMVSEGYLGYVVGRYEFLG